MRRALRIFPLYFGALLFILVLRAAWPNLGLYGTASDGWMWLYLTNVVIAVQGYGAFGLMDHFWSLAIEEHFYLVWPFVVFALDRRAAMWVAFGMCVVALSLRVVLTLATDNVAAIYVLSPLRMDALAVGALLALAIRGPSAVQLTRLVRPAIWIACANSIILAGILWITRDFSSHNPLMQTVGYTLMATLFGALIVLSLESWPRRVFELRLLRWFGKYSYGIYVWHPILWVIVFHSEWARSLRQGNGMLEALLSVGVAIVVVWVFVAASWYLLESQFLKLKGLYQ